MDLAGRLHTYQLITEQGTSLVLLRSQELATGIYIVRVPGTSLSERVMVQ